jgi:hypothetical protein
MSVPPLIWTDPTTMPSVAVRRLSSSDDICIDDAQPDDNSASTRMLLMNLMPLPFLAYLEHRARSSNERSGPLVAFLA